MEIATFADSLLGENLPTEAARHLRDAGATYQNDTVAERHLRDAESLAPEHAAVLIALYRFYFYKGRLREALAVARSCLRTAARENKLKQDWRNVQAGDGDFSSYEASMPRFYLFTLKAIAYLQMRLGCLDEGREAVMKLLELDPTDKIGARVLLGVLEAVAHDDYD